MITLLVGTAVIAFAIGCSAAFLSRLDQRPNRLWMYFTPLWSAPLFLCLLFLARKLLTNEPPGGTLPSNELKVEFALILSLVWLPLALIGWAVGRAVRGWRG